VICELLATTGPAGPALTPNVYDDVRQMFEFPFMVNAFRAGTIVAVVAGLIGWYMVVRGQSFVGHTLALVGFPGAAGAILLGVSVTLGYFAFSVVAAVVIAGFSPAGRRYAQESAITGTVQAVALALGALFTSLYGGFLNGWQALLFGDLTGVTGQQVVVLAVVGVCALGVLAAMGRPLLFASVDPDVARARGVPVRALSVLFLVLLGVTAAEVSQITGTLLVFALLVVPAATAQAWSARPAASVLLTVGLGLTVTWFALAAAFYTTYPIGFYLTSSAFAVYVSAVAVRAVRP
jgi:zinc/manganese transport system permease protein